MLTVWPRYANVWPVVRSFGGLFERSITEMRVTVDVPMQGWVVQGVGFYLHTIAALRSPRFSAFVFASPVRSHSLSLSLFSAFTKENIR